MWDVTLWGSCKNRQFGGMYRLHHQDKAISETLVLIRATQHHIPEDRILDSHHSRNLKSYKIHILCPVQFFSSTLC
jgi:hypothetical protein